MATNLARVEFSPFSGGNSGPKEVGTLGGCPEARVDAPKGLRALRVASKAPERVAKWVFCCAKRAENLFVQVATNFARIVFSPYSGENTGLKGVGTLGGRPRVRVDVPEGPRALRVASKAPERVEKRIFGCAKHSKNPIVLVTTNFPRKVFSPFSGYSTGPKGVGTQGGCLRTGVGFPRGPGVPRGASIPSETMEK